MQRRLVIAGLAATLAAPVVVIQPAAAAILFSCNSVTGSAVFSPGLAHDKRAQSLSSGPTAPAGPADIVLASTSDSGLKGNGSSVIASLSAAGTEVAFQSSATNLDPGDTDSTVDIYVKDLTTGDVTLVSTSDAGVKGNRDSLEPALSPDGTRVAFRSLADNLDPGDTDSISDIYVKDLTTGDITLASTSDTGAKGNDDSYMGSLSADGSRVAFSSRADNLDPADTEPPDTTFLNAWDVYVKDLTTGDITLVSSSVDGTDANDESDYPSLTADGTTVAFQSMATNLDARATNGKFGAYVKDLTTGDITLVSTSDTGVKGNFFSFVPALSGDGTAVVFGSYATNLDFADRATSDGDDYVKDLATGDITLASTSDTGVKGTTNSWASIYPGSLSADGSLVAFESSATNLDPGDTDSDADVYVKTLPSIATSVNIAGCSNGNSGTASIVDIRSYAPRPLGCPVALGGAAGNDYADTTPILVGATLSMTIDWASGPNSYGVAAAKAGPTGTQWRFRLAITASPGHDTPATNQYLPASGGGFTKTRLQGKLDVSALDSFNCTSGTADPLSWLSLANNGDWVAKTS